MKVFYVGGRSQTLSLSGMEGSVVNWRFVEYLPCPTAEVFHGLLHTDYRQSFSTNVQNSAKVHINYLDRRHHNSPAEEHFPLNLAGELWWHVIHWRHLILTSYDRATPCYVAVLRSPWFPDIFSGKQHRHHLRNLAIREFEQIVQIIPLTIPDSPPTPFACAVHRYRVSLSEAPKRPTKSP